MDNQHQKIKGYRDLNQNQIDLMNQIKEMGERVRELVQDIASSGSVDQRWVHIGMTDLQKGFMSLTRSIAQPTTF